MSTDQLGVEPLGKIPRYALFRGRRVRVLAYTPGERRAFHILDRFDNRLDVTRAQLKFLPEKKK